MLAKAIFVIVTILMTDTLWSKYILVNLQEESIVEPPTAINPSSGRFIRIVNGIRCEYKTTNNLNQNIEIFK